MSGRQGAGNKPMNTEMTKNRPGSSQRLLCARVFRYLIAQFMHLRRPVFKGKSYHYLGYREASLLCTRSAACPASVFRSPFYPLIRDNNRIHCDVHDPNFAL